MDALPTEIRRQILSHCNALGLKSLRLTSKIWATVGFEYLITSTFTTLPHRPDFTRLLAVSQIPILSNQIEALFINLGEINEYHARHNSYFIQYMRDADERLAAQEASWGAYAGFKAEKEKYMSLACSPSLLEPALGNLSNLKKVSYSLATCPFPEHDERTELLRQIWNIPSTRLVPREATTERFTALCSAIVGSPSQVEELSHDRLPFEFFAQKTITTSLASAVFSPLTKLSLCLDYSDMPNNLHALQGFQRLAHCLQSASSLQTLELSFTGRKKISIEEVFSRFWDSQHVFENLREVKLEGVRCTERALVSFLLAHESTLKKVQLGGVGMKAPHQKANGGVHLEEGTWRSVFKSLLEGLDLEPNCFLVQGDMVDPERAFVLEDLEAVESLGEFISD